MASRRYDCFMVHAHIGANPKFRELTAAERWTHVGGVLAIAAMSPVRGRLLIGNRPATEKDIAHVARVKVSVARSTIAKLIKAQVLHVESEFQSDFDPDSNELRSGCDRFAFDFDASCEHFAVHDWSEWNPPPKSNAERQRRYRERKKQRTEIAEKGSANNGRSNESVTPVTREVKRREEKLPPNPPEGGKRVTFNRKVVPSRTVELAESVLAAFNRSANQSYRPYTGTGKITPDLRVIVGFLMEFPDKDLEFCERLISSTLDHPWWSPGEPVSPGMVFSPKVVQKNIARLSASRPKLSTLEQKALFDKAHGRSR